MYVPYPKCLCCFVIPISIRGCPCFKNFQSGVSSIKGLPLKQVFKLGGPVQLVNAKQGRRQHD